MRLIEVAGLHKCFGSGNACTWALNGIDLGLDAGSYTVLEGRSGSGKTTLLNCIGALELPTRGEVLVAGQSLSRLSPDERAAFRLHHIGFIFQAYNLMGILTARENVAYPLQLKGAGRRQALRQADHWLAQVDLAGLGSRRPSELSGGQQQRVAVVRALASGPDIVLADEPTATRDTVTGEALVELLRRLNREYGTTFLIASHDPAVIESAPDVICLQDGRVCAQP